MRNSLFSRMWNTLKEPRIVTFFQILVYLMSIVTAVLIIVSPGPTPIDVALGSAMIMAGGLGSIISAWKGWWAMESAMGGMLLLGLSTVTASDVLRSLTTDGWIGWPLSVTLALASSIIGRMFLTKYYASYGNQSVLRLCEAQQTVEHERTLDRKMEEAARSE